MVTCKATPLYSMDSYLLTVMYILMVQCILGSLLGLSSNMDLLHQILMVLYRGNDLGILLLPAQPSKHE